MKATPAILLGLVAGIVLAAIFFKRIAEKRAPESRLPKERPSDGVGRSDPRTSAPAAELAAAKRELAALQKRNRDLEARLAGSDPRPQDLSPDATRLGAEKGDWKAIARRKEWATLYGCNVHEPPPK